MKRSLTPEPLSTAGIPSLRRAGGMRRQVSDRVRVEHEGKSLDGWALNLSRGGIRVILDEALPIGAELAIAVGEAALRPGRIVWVQDEPDGAVVGVEFLDRDSQSDLGPPSMLPPPPPEGEGEAGR